MFNITKSAHTWKTAIYAGYIDQLSCLPASGASLLCGADRPNILQSVVLHSGFNTKDVCRRLLEMHNSNQPFCFITCFFLGKKIRCHQKNVWEYRRKKFQGIFVVFRVLIMANNSIPTRFSCGCDVGGRDAGVEYE